MSQRKEKYLRRTLEQYDGIVRDVDALNLRIGALEVAHGSVRNRAAATEAERAMREAKERIKRRREDSKNQRRVEAYLCIAMCVGLVAVVAVVLILASAVTAPAGATGTAFTQDPALEEHSVAATQMHEIAEVADEAEHIEAALLDQGYFRDDVPLTYSEQDFLQTACEEFQVPYALALAVIEQESEFQNIPNSDGTCLGYMQIMPRWHSDRMAALGVVDLMDPYGNFRVGCSYLSELLEKYDTCDALCVYKSGSPGESNYTRKVLALYEKWEGLLHG